MFETYVTSALNIGLILTVGIIVVIIGIIGMNQYNDYKRYRQYLCLILTKDALGNCMMEKDGAGIFTDSTTNLKRFYLKKHKVGLDPDKVKYIPFGKLRYVILRKYSLKNFAFYDINEMLDENPQLKVTEQDVNWAIHEYRKHKALDSKNWLKEFLPMIIFVLTIIAILILMTWLFKKFDVIQAAANALDHAAASLAETSKNMAQAASGTKVMQ